MKTKILATLLALFVCSAMTFGQDTTNLAKKTLKPNMEMQKDTVFYTCTMHPGVNLDKPGKCPQCGMDLVKKAGKSATTVVKSEGVITYTCSMHPEITSDRSGKCPKCGMAMIVKK
jgi:hypothetical protein